MRRLLLATGILAATAGIASAADPMSAGPGVAPAPYSWTGVYVGAEAGHLWAEGCFCDINGLPNSRAEGPIDGWLGGVFAGYNHQFDNNIVLGVDADIGWYNAHDFVQFTDPVLPWPPRSGVDYHFKWGGSARLRAGYALDRFLPYIAGGVAYAQTQIDSLAQGFVSGPADPFMVGWTIGAGLDYAFTDRLIGRLEYRYVDFGDFEHRSNIDFATGNITASEMRLGVAYKF